MKPATKTQFREKTKMAKYKIYGLTAIILISFFLCYWTTVKGLYPLWINDEDYNYAFLVPVISGYLMWERRRQIANTPIGTNWWSGLIFFVFLIISVYGILGSSPSAVRPAMPLIILSITLFCFGWEMFKVLVFPFSLLIFMIPLPTLFGTVIGIHLKTISTLLGKLFLMLAGISVFVEGNVIDLGVTQLQVVDACSGLRFILPLLALGVLYAYFFERTLWKQVILVLSTTPIAILTNGFRIGATGVLARFYGPEVADGFFHGFSGWLVFMFAFGLLFLLHLILRYIPIKTDGGLKKKANKEENIPKIVSKSRNNIVPVMIASFFMLLVAFISFSTSALPTFKIHGGLGSFPMAIKDWSGQKELVPADIITLSGAEDAISVLYRNNKDSFISLYIGYRGSPFGESENFFHSPSVCLPSSGWETISIGTHDIADVPQFGNITVKMMLIERMGERQLVYYWFQTKSRVSHDVNINRLDLTLHAIKRDNTHDLFIRPIMPLKKDEKAEDAEKKMDQFVRDMMEILLQFLKEKQYT
jgi:exosortase D (VPLPA-CTERM-specific)